MLGRDCGQTKYSLKLASEETLPSWISLDAESRLIKYDMSSVQKAGTFSFELLANLEKYP